MAKNFGAVCTPDFFVFSPADGSDQRHLYYRGRLDDSWKNPARVTQQEMKDALDREQVTNQDDALRAASGQAFYNTSPFLLRDLKSRGSQQQLLADFEDYLNGFSPNVQDILENFKFRNQLHTLSKADASKRIDELRRRSPRLAQDS